MSELVLLAPLDGWVSPLEETPDPVFAGRMMGEGLAIDPTGQALHAPCAGTILKIHAALHAVTLRSPQGADLLLHVGIDTVGLGGQGFEAHVVDGQAVEAGQKLVSFDLDQLARSARSLITPVLVTNPDAFEVTALAANAEVAVGQPILRLTPRAAAGAPNSHASEEIASCAATITHAHGLHARPAAQVAAEAKRWNCETEIGVRGRTANARSPVALMSLGVVQGDSIEITARGPDAEAAVAALSEVVSHINAAPVAHPPTTPPSQRSAPEAPAPAHVIRGVRAAPGLAVGPAWRLKMADPPVETEARQPAQEAAALSAALIQANTQLEARIARVAGETRAVLIAHLSLLQDPDLAANAQAAIARGLSAGAAWREAVETSVGALRASGDARLAERASDLRDLERQVLWAIAGKAPEPPTPPPGAILLADDLLPGELAGLDGAGLAGLCTAGGGPTSHVAVLAAAMGIPAVVAAGEALGEVAEGAVVLLDGDAGLLDPRPGAERLDAAEAEIADRVRREQVALTTAGEPARMADGARIEVFANVGSLADAELAARHGAEGCGLLRTEFLFLDRATPPSEDEQASAYQAIATALHGRPIIIRTLDVGGDKPAPYLDLPSEENPALGVRGVRVSLRQPDMLRAQLRAILRLQPEGQCRIMAPMVSSVAEVAAVRRLVSECAAEIGRTAPVDLGVMIETPAAAATVDLLAADVDFFSIGTNDLSQYVLAMDRGNPTLAAEVDAMHPAVLRLIRLATTAAARHGRPVGVCGGLASDPAAVAVLIGLGVEEFSTTPSRVAATKALIRGLDMAGCQALAARACEQTSAAAVRALTAGKA